MYCFNSLRVLNIQNEIKMVTEGTLYIQCTYTAHYYIVQYYGFVQDYAITAAVVNVNRCDA